MKFKDFQYYILNEMPWLKSMIIEILLLITYYDLNKDGDKLIMTDLLK